MWEYSVLSCSSFRQLNKLHLKEMLYLGVKWFNVLDRLINISIKLAAVHEILPYTVCQDIFPRYLPFSKTSPDHGAVRLTPIINLGSRSLLDWSGASTSLLCILQSFATLWTSLYSIFLSLAESIQGPQRVTALFSDHGEFANSQQMKKATIGHLWKYNEVEYFGK